MNKIYKIGCSALCGSLAAVSAANAGGLSASGSAQATWVSTEGANNGNPIGLNSAIAFAGNGELDNGSTFTLTLSQLDKDAWSSGSLAITTPSFGSFRIGSADGGMGVGSKDDVMPTAWEESWGNGLTVGHDRVSGAGSSMYLGYTTPEFAGSTVSVMYAPKNNGKQAADKGTGVGGGDRKQAAYDITLDMNKSYAYMMPNVFVGYSASEQDGHEKISGLGSEGSLDDHEEIIAGAIFSIGPVKAGAQVSGEWLGNNNNVTVADVAGYKNVAYGISFNINDDLAVSWAKHESKKGLVSSDQGAGNTTVRSNVESIQLSYTMGGASIKIADSSVEDQNYVTGTSGDRDATVIALSLAF